MSKKNPWTTLSETIPYENPWIKVSHREVLNPSGGEGIYGVVHFKNIAVGIIPIDAEGNTWLVGQYRYPLKRYSWEIPEGGCPIGTDTLDTAKRELLEETGISAKKWTAIQELDLSNSVSDETGIVYIAEDLSFGESEPEPTEDLQIKKTPFSEVFQMCLNGEITDSLSVIAVYRAWFWLKENQKMDK